MPLALSNKSSFVAKRSIFLSKFAVKLRNAESNARTAINNIAKFATRDASIVNPQIANQIRRSPEHDLHRLRHGAAEEDVLVGLVMNAVEVGAVNELAGVDEADP